MAQGPDWKQLLEAGMQFTELRRSQARRIAQDLASQGQIARDQLASTVDELLDMSRRRTEDLTRVVRQEVQRQLGSLGLATKADLERVERRLGGVPTAAPAAAKKAAAKKAPAKKATAKAAAKRSTAKKPAAKKTAKKAPAAGGSNGAAAPGASPSGTASG
jgi:polyhydroxyalkanoate synthesis regulator phasin